MDLVNGLEILRTIVGVPILINSGVRCASHNAEVGGGTHSQHLLGNAADIRSSQTPISELWKFARNIFDKGGIGVYVNPDFLHLDVRDGAARWGSVDGQAVAYRQAVSAMLGEEEEPEEQGSA